MLFSAEKTNSLSCLPDSRQAGLPDPGAPGQAGQNRLDVFAHSPCRVCQTGLGTSRPVWRFCDF